MNEFGRPTPPEAYVSQEQATPPADQSTLEVGPEVRAPEENAEVEERPEMARVSAQQFKALVRTAEWPKGTITEQQRLSILERLMALAEAPDMNVDIREVPVAIHERLADAKARNVGSEVAIFPDKYSHPAVHIRRFVGPRGTMYISTDRIGYRYDIVSDGVWYSSLTEATRANLISDMASLLSA